MGKSEATNPSIDCSCIGAVVQLVLNVQIHNPGLFMDGFFSLSICGCLPFRSWTWRESMVDNVSHRHIGVKSAPSPQILVLVFAN
jgi:hypothetical protein